ncbi:MAG: DUF3783 domain-containing protein [Clostridiales bacterium]|nr:DUF3783 domain-containing protein [Clostridiales bacterium]
MNQAMALCYNMEGDRADQVRQLAADLGIEAFLVPREAYLQKIGALCGLFPPTEEAYHGEGFEGEMMLMAYFEKGLLSRFLDGFRERGMRPVHLKAMLTEKNSEWNSLALQAELLDEYEHFKKIHKMQKNRG